MSRATSAIRPVSTSRARMGLGPLAAYLEQLATSYGPPEPATLTCRACGTAVEFWPPEDTEPRTLDCPGCGERITVRVTR